MATSTKKKQNRPAPIAEVHITQIDRSPKTVKLLRQAHIAAESPFYPSEARLYDIMEDVLIDGHLSGIVEKRIDQVINKTLLFRKGNDDVPEMDAAFLKTPARRAVMKALMERKLFGRVGMEFIPGDRIQFNEIPRKHIKLKTRKIVPEQWMQDEGLNIDDFPNVWVLGKPNEFGLLHKCAYYALLKRGMFGDWASYIELYGSPVIILKYEGTNRDDKLAGEAIIKKSGNSQKLLIPKSMDWDMKDGKASNGDGKLQEIFRLATNQEMSLIVLGNTETSASGQHGSEGKSKTHSEQQKEIMKSDMEYILDELNSDHFLNILRSYGMPVDGGYFEFDKEVDIEYLKEKIKIDLPLIKEMGLKVATSYLYETYNIPQPKPDEECIDIEPAGSEEDPDNEKKLSSRGTRDLKKPKKPVILSAAKDLDEKPLSAADISAMMDEKLSAFFGHAL